ncbi:hypothetical protein MKX01_021115 [Papaver californicum]|nr:hypothetical protein MKX01_021115 [Papaver californicum]
MMKVIRYDTEVATSADSVWAVYSSPDIPRLLRGVLLPGVFEKLDVIQGNGGVGTVLDIVFPPGAVPRSYKEKFINIDLEKRLKEVIMVEGGYLDMGCTFYLDRIHVPAKTPESCIIESSIVYEVKEECVDAISKLITTEPLKSMADVISNYVTQKESVSARSTLPSQPLVKKEIRYDLEVPTSADSIWAVYNTPNIPRLLRDVLLPGVFEKLDVIEGDGGAGTVLDIVFPPGAVPRSYKEKFVNINHEKRLKEVIMIEGGYLDMRSIKRSDYDRRRNLDIGCTFYLDRIHVIEKTSKSCVIKSSVVYEVKEEKADAISKLTTTEPLKSMAEVISNYAIKHQAVFGKNIPKKQSLVKKEIRYDVEVPTSADSIWAVYSTPDIPRLLRDVLLPGVFEKLDVIEGDGGVGTVLDIVFPPEICDINHEKRLKEVIMIEGGYLDMGCTLYLDRIHVIEKTSKLVSLNSSSCFGFKKKTLMRKEITYEMEVPTSADSIWEIYSSPEIPRLLRDVLLPGVFEKLDIIEGDGSVGTVLDIAFPLGAVPRSYKEKFVKFNHEKRLKEVIMVEGGYLDIGCTYYMDRIHVLEKTPNSCVIESSIVYEVKEENANRISKLITTEPLKSMAEVISSYVLKNQLRVFGFKIKPKLGLRMLLRMIICLVILGGMLIGGVPL